MSLIRDPLKPGMIWRYLKIVREKKRDLPLMRRSAIRKVAWRQARNAEGLK